MRLRFQGTKRTALFLATMGFVACRTASDSSVKVNEAVPYDGEHGMKPGIGYETIFEDVRGECVDYDGLEPANTAQETIYNVKIVEHTQELGVDLAVSNAAQIKAAVPDSPATVSAKTNFALGHSYSLNRYSIFILAKVQVRNETSLLKTPRIKQVYLDQLANADKDPDVVDRLRLNCGDAFMAGYTTGGEFFGVLELSTDSEEQKSELKRSVEAAISAEGVGSVETQQSMELKLKKVVKDKNVKIWTYQRGGQGSAEVGLVDTPELMLDRIRKFPDYVKTGANAANYTATFKDYFTLNVPLPLEYRKALLSAQDNIQELAGLQAELIDRRGDIDYVIQHPNSFEGLTPAKLNELKGIKTANESLIKGIFKNAKECYRDFRACKIKDEVRPKPLTLPNRKSTIASVTNDFVLINTKVENIDINALYDGPFNPPECYLEVRVVAPNGRYKRIRRTPTTYDNPRCNNLNQTLEVPLSVIREAAKGIGASEDNVNLDVLVFEDDPGDQDDDLVGKLPKSYKDIKTQAAIADTLTGPSITMQVSYEVH